MPFRRKRAKMERLISILWTVQVAPDWFRGAATLGIALDVDRSAPEKSMGELLQALESFTGADITSISGRSPVKAKKCRSTRRKRSI